VRPARLSAGVRRPSIGVGIGFGIGIEIQGDDMSFRHEGLAGHAAAGIDPDADTDSDPVPRGAATNHEEHEVHEGTVSIALSLPPLRALRVLRGGEGGSCGVWCELLDPRPNQPLEPTGLSWRHLRDHRAPAAQRPRWTALPKRGMRWPNP
jgi:hypothetical protein